MIPQRRVKVFHVQQYFDKNISYRDDQIVVEEPLEIRLLYYEEGVYKRETLTVTMRTPGHDFELAYGFLNAEGIIRKNSDIIKMSYCVKGLEQSQEYNILQVKLAPTLQVNWTEIKRNFMSSSSCGVCGKTSLASLAIKCSAFERFFDLDTQAIYQLLNRFSPAQTVFHKTGGLHGAALFDSKGELLVLQEDIGRHNAVDKAVGFQLMTGKKSFFSQSILVVSGRTSYEILQKALMAGIPCVIGVGPPSSLAVELARKFNMTLIGFLKETSFNVYSGSERFL